MVVRALRIWFCGEILKIVLKLSLFINFEAIPDFICANFGLHLYGDASVMSMQMRSVL